MGEIEDQLEHLAARRAAEVLAFSIATADEPVVHRRVHAPPARDRRDRGLCGNRAGDRSLAPPLRDSRAACRRDHCGGRRGNQ